MRKFLYPIFACLLSGCAAMPPAPPAEPRFAPVEAPRVVQEKCKDQRPPPSDYPDTNERLSMIADGDFEALAKASRAGRDLRDARLVVDDVQIKGCAGEK